MFTGIIEERGIVREAGTHRLVVSTRTVQADSEVGASISVNGVCLTVVSRDEDGLAFDLSDETLARSNLGRLGAGDPVNLERPITLASRLGGHLVQGHVDGVGEVTALDRDEAGGACLTLRLPAPLLGWVVEKGSLALDGVSLTVAEVHPAGVSVELVPHTLGVTTLGAAVPGDAVNVEVDLIAKYVARYVSSSGSASGSASGSGGDPGGDEEPEGPMEGETG